MSFAGIQNALLFLLLALPVLPALVLHAQEDAPPPAGEPQAAPIVREIEVRGNLRIDAGTVLRMIRTRVGRPFDQKVWDDDWHRLTDSGFFLNVRTTPPIPWPGGVKVVIDLVELATIKKIEFKGSKSISKGELANAIKSTEGGRFQEGQVHLDSKKIEEVYRSKAFRDATCTYKVDVISTHKQRVGAGWEDIWDEVKVTFVVDEGHPISIRTVKFIGNEIYKDAKLIAVIQSKPKRLLRAGDLIDANVETDKKRIEGWYLRNGYMDVSVDQVDVELTKQTYFNWWRKRKRLADVTFHITEGEQYFVGEVSIEGHKSLSDREIQAVMKLKPRAVYSDLLLNDDRESIQKLYGEFGRVFTAVQTDRKLVTDPERLKKQPNQFDVMLRVREGAEVTVRQVITRGNNKTKDKVLIRQLDLFPGDRIDTSKMEGAKTRLRRLQYFEEDVRITPEPTENPEEADLIIDVTEVPTGEFNFGLGVSSVDSLLGNVSLTQRNFDWKDMPKSWNDLLGGNAFTGAGQRFSIEAQAGTSRQRYTVSFYEPWTFDRPIRTGGSLFRTVDNNFRDFNETSTGFTLTIGRRLWSPRWDTDLTYRFSYTDIGNTETEQPEIFQQQEGARILSSIKPRIVYDSRDSVLLPSRGYLFEASAEIGGGPFFGSLDWVRPQIDIARWFTVFKLPGGGKHILEMRGMATMVEAYGDTDDIPPFMRNYGGGIGTIRGFESRTVAPIQDGYLIGGKKMVVGSVEYSLPLYDEVVRGLVFADAGQVWDPGETDPGSTVTNETGLRATVGVGLAIRTPFSPLPLRVYISRNISKNQQDRTKVVDFTFGTRF